MIKGNLGFKSCLLLGLSAAVLLCSVQQQVTATPTTTTTTNQETRPLTNLPPIEEPGPLLPYKEPSSVNKDQKASSVTPKLATQLVIKLSERRVYVYQKNQVLAKYPIAIGRTKWETPKGNFKVFHKERNPAWENPFTGKVISSGPDNPLGVAWIGFWSDGRNQIGFHGTPQENLVGQAVSHGCVRMRNKDVTALFEQVEIGTPVKVQQ
ncbi:MAG TPA: L,D-transpeptidase [Oculatellaceae cyanobacterium]|jgi:lipoprotein-anchoring transpeptidase ErfK/SrfK